MGLTGSDWNKGKLGIASSRHEHRVDTAVALLMQLKPKSS